MVSSIRDVHYKDWVTSLGKERVYRFYKQLLGKRMERNFLIHKC